MVDQEEWMEVKSLHRDGHSIREIAAITGLARNTVRAVLREPFPKPYPTCGRQSGLDPYKQYLKSRCENGRLPAPKLLEEIRAMGFTGSVDTVQRFIKTLHEDHARLSTMTVRFETPPGKQAQADWFEVARMEDGQRVYAFMMVLGFSRMLYVEFTQSMRLEALIRCHQSAFGYFGGVPGEILYDNMAQVRLPGSREVHPLMADFATHYGFAVKTHRVRRPRTKGKVERAGGYLQENFLMGSTFAGLDDLRPQGRAWMEKANCRIHSTTGQRPCDLLVKEELTPYSSAAPYVLADRHDRKVDAEGYVRLDNSRYSVPPEYVGKRVILTLGERSSSNSAALPLQVRSGDVVIAEHRVALVPGSSVTVPEHAAAMWRESMGQTRSPVPKVTFTAADAVPVRALSVYEAAAAGAEQSSGDRQ